MVPLLLSIEKKMEFHHLSMEWFYRFLGVSRQAVHKAKSRYEQKQSILSNMEDKIKSYRQTIDRRAGSRSLFYNLDIKNEFQIGVNKFEQALSENGLNLRPLRTRVVTTSSSMQSWNYANLINGISLNDINKVVVGDITYVYFGHKLYYLFCLTDVYSARIVGYQLNTRMRATDAKECLGRWVKLRKKKNLKGCIHHTDGGGQYFSALYLGELDDLKVEVSCAENCLMNGYAEQRNGLIKHHLIPTIKVTDNLLLLQKEIKRVIEIYNYERKQKELGWLSPVEFEKKISTMTKKPIMKLYKFDNG